MAFATTDVGVINNTLAFLTIRLYDNFSSKTKKTAMYST